MKRVIWLLLISSLLLGSCIARDVGGGTNPPTDSEAGEGEDGGTEVPPLTTEDGDAAAGELAYYVEVIAELREEILSLQSRLYADRVRYEERIEELEAQLSQSGAAVPQESLFTYTVENGAATVTGYLGDASAVTVPAELGGFPVRAIGDGAFRDCHRLQSVILPQGIERIGWFAFSGCVSLTSILLPISVDSIEYGAFLNCDAMLTVLCSAGSYAEQYARSYGLKTRAA